MSLLKAEEHLQKYELEKASNYKKWIDVCKKI